MQLPSWLSWLTSRVSDSVKAVLKRWKPILESERGLFMAEIAVQAGPLITEMANDATKSGAEKRDYVTGQLSSIFIKHALIASGRIAASELSILMNAAVENELVARLTEGGGGKK